MYSKIVIVFLLVVWLGMIYRPSSPTATVAKPSPEFAWVDFSGHKTTLSAWKGRSVILHFWASWCAPCKKEFPALIKAATRHSEVEFLLISVDEDAAKALAFLPKSLPRNMHLAWDPNRLIATDLFHTVMFPETVLLDASHVMRQKFAGPAEWDSKPVEDALLSLSNSRTHD